MRVSQHYKRYGHSPFQILSGCTETSMISCIKFHTILYVVVVALLGTMSMSLQWFLQIIAFYHHWQLSLRKSPLHSTVELLVWMSSTLWLIYWLSQIKRLCQRCHSSLSHGSIPVEALANFHWVGPVPEELKDLT